MSNSKEKIVFPITLAIIIIIVLYSLIRILFGGFSYPYHLFIVLTSLSIGLLVYYFSNAKRFSEKKKNVIKIISSLCLGYLVFVLSFVLLLFLALNVYDIGSPIVIILSIVLGLIAMFLFYKKVW